MNFLSGVYYFDFVTKSEQITLIRMPVHEAQKTSNFEQPKGPVTIERIQALASREKAGFLSGPRDVPLVASEANIQHAEACGTMISVRT
jgi:hypothetical protein